MQNKRLEIVFATILGLILIFVGMYKINDKNIVNKDNEDEFTYTPLMYKICDDDSCIYLLGSIHIGDDRVNNFNDVIVNAYNESDYLAVELDITNINMDINEFMLESDKTLDDYISDELYNKLVNFSNEHSMFPYSTLKKFKLGYLSDYLTLLPYLEAGYSADGVDAYFINLASNDNKEIISLETYEEQLNLLLGYSDEFYINQIEYLIDNYELVKEEATNLYETYLKGDKEKLENIINNDIEQAETDEEIEYNKAIYDDRNIYMANKVEEFLANNEQVFMTVGCAHVIGENGIISLLSDKYKISIVK